MFVIWNEKVLEVPVKNEEKNIGKLLALFKKYNRKFGQGNLSVLSFKGPSLSNTYHGYL